MSLVVISESGVKKVNRNNYEIAVLEELRLKLTCKMIWIEGAHRYRNQSMIFQKILRKDVSIILN